MGDCGIIKDELMVEVDKVKEGLYFLNFGGNWPGSNAIEFYRVHGKLTRFHNHSEVFNFGDVELTFFELQIEVKLSHALENSSGSFGMGFKVRGGNEEVVHVDDEPSLSDHIME